MIEVYDQAAMRHFKDAQLLEANNRLENADQLYGFSTECAVKWVWPSLLKSDIPHKHINDLWDKLHLQSTQRAYPNLYTILGKKNPFANWSVNQRYEADNIVSKETLKSHRDIAKRIIGSVGLLGERRN